MTETHRKARFPPTGKALESPRKHGTLALVGAYQPPLRKSSALIAPTAGSSRRARPEALVYPPCARATQSLNCRR